MPGKGPGLSSVGPDVLDDTTIAIAERPGKGRNETLRIDGRARLLRDAPFFDDLIVKGHRPVLVLLVEIDQIFFHCAKAFMRSQLWRPDSWHPDVCPLTRRW